MNTLVVEDLQLNLIYEQIALPPGDINLVIREVVLLNVEMGKSIYLRRNVMMGILMIMTGAAQHAQ